MKQLTIVLSILTVFVLGGCVQGPSTKYVALRPIPDSPSFVVSSFNNHQAQVMCANLAEGALISAGVSVVQMPHIKEVEIRKGIGAGKDKLDTKAPSLNSSGAYEMRIENYSQYEKTNASYLIKTNGFVTYYDNVPYIDKINITVSKLDKTKEIVASFVTYEHSINDDVYNHLKTLGIKVRPDKNMTSP